MQLKKLKLPRSQAPISRHPRGTRFPFSSERSARSRAHMKSNRAHRWRETTFALLYTPGEQQPPKCDIIVVYRSEADSFHAARKPKEVSITMPRGRAGPAHRQIYFSVAKGREDTANVWFFIGCGVRVWGEPETAHVTLPFPTTNGASFIVMNKF